MMSNDADNTGDKLWCFPWHKIDDLILFAMLLLLILFVGLRGHWDLVETLSNNLVGAVIMYIKGEVTKR